MGEEQGTIGQGLTSLRHPWLPSLSIEPPVYVHTVLLPEPLFHVISLASLTFSTRPEALWGQVQCWTGTLERPRLELCPGEASQWCAAGTDFDRPRRSEPGGTRHFTNSLPHCNAPARQVVPTLQMGKLRHEVNAPSHAARKWQSQDSNPGRRLCGRGVSLYLGCQDLYFQTLS